MAAPWSTIGKAFRSRAGRHPAPDPERERVKAERAAAKAEKARRARFLEEAEAMTPYLAAQVDDEVLFVATRDRGVGKQVFVGRWRKDLTVLQRALDWMAENAVRLPDAPMLVDVGANIGTTTVMALRRHGFDSAVTIEPSPENSRVLRLNVIANDLENRVRHFEVAAGEREGRISLDVSKANFGGHHVATGPAQDVVSVEAVTLDGLVTQGIVDPERVGLVWIDAQGHEPAVLAGASSLVDAGVPMVVAVRQVKGDPETARPWVAPEDLRARVLASLRAGYTEAVELRKHSHLGRKVHPIDELDVLVDSFRHCQDLLLVHRA